MATRGPHIAAHLEWLGFVQPTGLVVSGTALVRANAILDRFDRVTQDRLRECVEDVDAEPVIPDFQRFARNVLGWTFSPKGYAGLGTAEPIPPQLELPLPDDGGALAPDLSVR